MNLFDTSIDSVPPDLLPDHIRRLKAYLLAAPDPNAVNADGETCLSLALAFCAGDDGEQLVATLLDRGADPNRPSALANFHTFMITAKRVVTLEKLIEAGLKVNEVYTVEPELLPTGRGGEITLLDYALDVEASLNKRARNKNFVRLVEKHAGPLTGRRRFVADVISLLIANRATRAADES